MKYLVTISLTGVAKALFQDDTSLAQVDFAGVYPNAGDTLAIRGWPGNELLNLRCSSRHFDFSEAAQPRLCIVVDMQGPGVVSDR